jgi:hypothetical protein
MKNRHVLILGLLPLALFLIGAAAVSRDLVIQNASNAPGLTIIKPGSQTSNLIEAYIGSGSKLSLSRDGNMALNGYLSLSGATNRITVADGALLLDGAGVGGVSGDPFVITSELADNATSVALVVDSEVEWTEGDLAWFKNNGSRQSGVTPWGGYWQGNKTYYDALEGTPTATDGFVSFRFKDLDGSNSARRLKLHSLMDTNYTAEGSFAVLTVANATNDANATVTVSGFGDTTSVWSLKANGDSANGSYFSFNTSLDFRPQSAVNALAYKLGTDYTHTSGNLVEVENGGTDKLAVDYRGALVLTQGGSGITPANASATGTAGTIIWDSGFLYVCVAANTWKRVAIATW